MKTRTMRMLAILLAFVFFATACGGESSGDGDIQAIDLTSDEPLEEPLEEPSDGEPNIYDDPRDGVFDEFQSTFDRGVPTKVVGRLFHYPWGIGCQSSEREFGS